MPLVPAPTPGNPYAQAASGQAVVHMGTQVITHMGTQVAGRTLEPEDLPRALYNDYRAHYRH